MVKLLPAREYPLDRGAISRFQMNWYDAFDVDHDACPTYTELGDEISPRGEVSVQGVMLAKCHHQGLLRRLPAEMSALRKGRLPVCLQ